MRLGNASDFLVRFTSEPMSAPRFDEAIQDSFNQAGVEIMSPTFYALRDGNTVTTPESARPPGYQPPAFRLKDANAQSITATDA